MYLSLRQAWGQAYFDKMCIRDRYASYNGLVWKKGMDETCLENANKIDPDKIIMRYADVLLMYAAATIELHQIDPVSYTHLDVYKRQ